MPNTQNHTGQISTELVKADIEEIRNNYTKPEYWQKKWVIFKHGNVAYTLSISRIDTEDMSICMKIRSNVNGDWHSETFYAYVNHPEYSQEKFSKDIETTLLELIHDQERTKLYSSETYKKLCDESRKIDTQVRVKAAAWLDEKGETNKKVRKFYIDATSNAYWNEHKKPEDEYISKNAYKVMTNVYILALTWFENEKIFKEYMENIIPKSTAKNNMALLVWRMKKELTDDEFVKQYLDNAMEDDD